MNKLQHIFVCMALLATTTIVTMKRRQCYDSPIEQTLTNKAIAAKEVERTFPLFSQLDDDIIQNPIFSNSSIPCIIALSKTCKKLQDWFTLDALFANAQKTQHLSTDFCWYTNALSFYAKENNKTTFNVLWNNQSEENKTKRLEYLSAMGIKQKAHAECLYGKWPYLSCYQSFQPNTFTTLVNDAVKKLIIPKIVTYLGKSIKNNDYNAVHLALTSVYKKDFLDKHYDGETFLLSACKLPTTDILKLLLKNDIETCCNAESFGSCNILHCLFLLQGTSENLIEKTRLILECYEKQYPRYHTYLQNFAHLNSFDTPLHMLLRTFTRNNINGEKLSELIDIITILKLYNVNITAHNDKGLTAFECIAESYPDKHKAAILKALTTNNH